MGIEKFAGLIGLAVVLFYVFHPDMGKGTANDILIGAGDGSSSFIASLQGGGRVLPRY